jgi:hypothetical protein
MRTIDDDYNLQQNETKRTETPSSRIRIIAASHSKTMSKNSNNLTLPVAAPVAAPADAAGESVARRHYCGWD